MSLKTHNARSSWRAMVLLAAAVLVTYTSKEMRADTGTCSGQSLTLPFTDVPGSNTFFCSIAQAFFAGLTNGTTPTAYSPAANVTREQMAAFITRTQDSALRRGSQRATAGQWLTPKDVGVLNTTGVGDSPQFNCFDGEDIWVPNRTDNSVTRVHASDGRSLGTWTGASNAYNAIVAAGFIYITGNENPGKIYRINPSFSPVAVTTIEDNVGAFPGSITYDGLNLWTANAGTGPGTGSITRYNIVTGTATTIGVGFNRPAGIVFDGTHLWVADLGDDALYRVNPSNGTLIEAVDLNTIASSSMGIPIFDGSNIWVPCNVAIKVVSTSTPARLVATLVGNGLDESTRAAAFDGERILVTTGLGNSISLWRASSLTPITNLALGSGMTANGVCSDGMNFWIAVDTPNSGDVLMRF